MDFRREIAGVIEVCIKEKYGNLHMPAVGTLLELPPKPEMGDYAFPCFRLAQPLRLSPQVIAQTIADGVSANTYIDSAVAQGGYVNIFLNKSAYARGVIGDVLTLKDKYGASDEGAHRAVCIDYSSINIAKRFHIGHLWTTMIGAALYNLYNFYGYKAVGINHLGDWGTQFGKMISAYLRWGNEADVESRGVHELVDLYIRFHDEAKAHPELDDEGRAWFKKIEDGDPEAMRLFTWFKEITLRYAMGIYDALGVKFDSYAGESFYYDKTQPVIDELKARGLLVESDGAMIVNLEDEHMPPALILRSDGATLYITRDLAAAFYRKNTYDFARSLYVVAYHQDLQFRQLFAVLKKMGCDFVDDMEHVSFGMVSYEGRALSTREGHIVYLDDVLDRAVTKARDIMLNKNPGLENLGDVAGKVGIGAVVFFALSNNRIKDVDFWWDRTLNFDGETGPYAQYTHARCASVLRKAADLPKSDPDYAGLSSLEAQGVVKQLELFPTVIKESIAKNEPSFVTRHIIDLAQAYNRFYYEHRIIDEAPGVRDARLQLTRATAQVLHTALTLINVCPVERM